MPLVSLGREPSGSLHPRAAELHSGQWGGHDALAAKCACLMAGSGRDGPCRIVFFSCLDQRVDASFSPTDRPGHDRRFALDASKIERELAQPLAKMAAASTFNACLKMGSAL